MRATLARVVVPDADAAERRARQVVLDAFAAREPVTHRATPARRVVALAVLVVAGVAGAALSPPGRAVVDRLREVVGVEQAQPALFRLPTAGRLLVASDPGLWVVDRDGSKRLLPGYREASWSPFGRYVVATRRNELTALEPDGDVRWTLARPDVRFPRWTGTETDTRIAYLSGTALRVVSGDGTGDRRLRPTVRAVAPAWRPGGGFVLTYVDASGAVVSEDVERRIVLWRTRPTRPVLQLAWSADGRRLLVRDERSVELRTREGVRYTAVRVTGSRVTASAFRSSLHENTHALERGGSSQVLHNGEGGGRLFSGRGKFSGLAWSPDRSWLLVGWPAADQWVFVRADGGSIRAVSNVSQQFRSRAFPRVQGWCCTREPRK